jgi:hypothetical protein
LPEIPLQVLQRTVPFGKFPGFDQSETNNAFAGPHSLTPLAQRTPFTRKLAVLHIDLESATEVCQSETCNPEPVTKMQIAPEHPFALSGMMLMLGTGLFEVTSGADAVATPEVMTPTPTIKSPAATTWATVRRERTRMCMFPPFR